MICSRAWEEVNIDLSENKLRYCCKSGPGTVFSENEIYSNPYIDKVRDDLKNGVRNYDHCEHCYNSYDHTGTSYRDVVNDWDSVDDIQERPWLLELKFDNFCDMSCVYCYPAQSHRIAKELNTEQIIYNSTDEEYKKIVMWIKSIHSDRFTLKFMGGELSYSPNFYKFMEYLIAELKDYKITISIITNCNTEGNRRDKFYSLLDNLPEKWVCYMTISNEATGKLAELVRWGLRWETFKENYEYYAIHPKVQKIILCPTLSVYSVKQFSGYLKYIFEVTKKPIIITGNFVMDESYNALKYANDDSDLYKSMDMVRDTDANIVNLDDTIKWLENMIKIVNSPADQSKTVNYIDVLSKQKDSELVKELKKYI